MPSTLRTAAALPTLFFATVLAACTAADGSVVDEGDPAMTPEDLSPITTQSMEEGHVDEPDPDGAIVSEREGEGTLSGLWVYDHVQAFANSACKYVSACSNGTYRGHSPTASRAVDLMVSKYGTYTSAGSTKGDALAAFATANRKKFGIMYVIWKQKINSFDGRGWRQMENRGSITQNHFDHVHVSFYTSASMSTPINTGDSAPKTTCNSYTLGREVNVGVCVQSKVDYDWYQCGKTGSWLAAPKVTRTGGTGPIGACTAKYAR